MAILNKAGLLLLLLTPLSYAQYPEQVQIRQDQAGIGQRCSIENTVSTAPSSRYQQNKEGTVFDTETGLTWRTCLEGVTGQACDQGKPLELTWADALLYVSGFNGQGGFAGHTDWRLPNIRELSTLVELQCVNPAINLSFFPNAAATDVWTSSPALFHAHYSWHVNFGIGAFAYGEREKAKSVRLVRDGK